jgi:hypothetical protein
MPLRAWAIADVADGTRAPACVEGQGLNWTVKQASIEPAERRRNNPIFKAKLAKIIEEDRQLLERLSR